MTHSYLEAATNGMFRLHVDEERLQRDFFRERDERLLTIAYNKGPDQIATVDGEPVLVRAKAVLPLMVNQSFTFERPTDIVAWQFNREFYCIVDHDAEVSCSGLLFYTNTEAFTLQCGPDEVRRLETLLLVMQDEFELKDRMQGEMLRTLLKRLIIIATRLTREQRVRSNAPGTEVDLMRHFNLLVENHYKKLHQVKDYAALLHRSPKTLANLFAKEGGRTPQQVIHHRVELEARRMLLFTDKPVKEIAYTIGFEDPALFARFFRQRTGTAPIDFRKAGIGVKKVAWSIAQIGPR